MNHFYATTRVVFSFEPRSYAQAIGGAVAALRGHLEVLVVELEEVVGEGALHSGAVVVSSLPRPETSHTTVRWVQYDPYKEPEMVRVDGVVERIPDLGMDDILGLVDRLSASAYGAAV